MTHWPSVDDAYDQMDIAETELERRNAEVVQVHRKFAGCLAGCGRDDYRLDDCRHKCGAAHAKALSSTYAKIAELHESWLEDSGIRHSMEMDLKAAAMSRD